MKTKTLNTKPAVWSVITKKLNVFALLFVLLLCVSTSKACTDRGLNNPCFFINDRNEVNLNVEINSIYWNCTHNDVVTGNAYITYSIILYDNAGIYIGTFPAQSNSNPFIVNIGAGFSPPYKFDIVETVMSSITNTVISTTNWGVLQTIDTKCDKPDPNVISACFKNDRQSIYSNFVFQVPAGLYAYCLANNKTPVLYITTGSVTIAGPVSPATFNYTSLTYNVFPFLDPNTCYEGGLIFRDNATGVEDPSAYWLSSNNPLNPYGVICNCVTCDAGFSVDEHLHDVNNTDVSFLSYNPSAIATQTYIITGSNGSYTSDGTSSLLLPNGTYTVCHTVITKTKEECTVCKVVTITGDNGDPSDPSGPLGKLISGASLLPNPSSDATSLTFTLLQNSTVEVQIINSFGRTIKNVLDKKFLSKGDQKLNFSTSDMEEGLYTIRITLDSEVKTINLMVRH